jgi:uncharacterized protein HemX
MRFWKRKKQQVEQAVDEVATTATDLAEKTMVIGPAGVLLLLGAAAVGAAATYYVTQKNKKAASDEAASSKSNKRS